MTIVARQDPVRVADVGIGLVEIEINIAGIFWVCGAAVGSFRVCAVD